MLMMWKIQQAKQEDAEFIRKINPAFLPVTGLKCSYGKIPVGKTEISVTELARPLNTWKIYKRFRGKARFPKQGSCEDALKRKINVFSYKDH